MYTIFRDTAVLTNVKPLNNSELSQKKQSEDVIRLNFETVEFVDLKIGDFVVSAKTGQKYILNKKPRTVDTPQKYKYECVFEGGFHHFYKAKVFLQTAKTSGYYQDYKFPLTGNAQTFLEFIVWNLNRAGGSYIAGAYKDTETFTVDFNNWNVFEAITSLSELLIFDWYLEGNILHFDERSKEGAQIYLVGRGLGFTQLTRTRVENENIETVVYGYGSSKNLPQRDTYDSDLLTENRLSFTGVDNESKLTNNTGLYGEIENVQEFDEIKPEYLGSATSVGDLNEFFDTSIDFDINSYLLPGIVPKCTFLTGKLLGRTFDLAFTYSTKKFELVEVTEEAGTFPNDLINIEVGDQYTLTDLEMPTAYITTAQTRLQAATQEYLDQQSTGLEFFEAVVDDYFIDENNVILNIGDPVRVVSGAFDIDNVYEIKELTQNINNENKYKIKFGDLLPKSVLATLKSSNFSNEQNIYNVSNSSVSSTQVTNITGAAVSWESL